MKHCRKCGSRLGIDCGEAEPDYNSHFCSKGCHMDYTVNRLMEYAVTVEDFTEEEVTEYLQQNHPYVFEESFACERGSDDQ